jgi:putative ABC transport system permease protein
VRFLNAFSLTTGPTGAPIFFDLQIDARVMLFTAAATISTTFAFGLVPALQATRVDLISAFKGSGSRSGRNRSRLRGALIIAQVAVVFPLVAAAALMFRSLQNTGHLDVGFEPDQVAIASFDLQTLGYDRQRMEAFYDELLRRARTLPGVERAALADFVPMGGRGAGLTLTIPGRTAAAGQDRFTVPYNRISDDYFATVRQTLLRGRDFTPRDTPESPQVAIVNEAMVRRFWPAEDPLGQRVRVAGEAVDREIIAVAKDARYASYGDDVGPFIFLPATQLYGPRLTLHVRSAAGPAETLAAVRRLVRDIDSSVAPHSGQSMREAMAFSLVPARVAHTVFSVAGVIGLLLGAGGLYGLVAYNLERRLKEIGIRVALGATRRQVFRVIAGGAVRLTAIGVVIGMGAAAAALRLLSAMLYGLSPTDPLTFGAVAALLFLVALAAGYGAARKGLEVDPMIVLRHE